MRTLKMTTPIARHPTRVFPIIVDERAERYGDAPALLSDRESFTYRQLAARANRLGIGPQGYGGDTTSFGIHMLAYPCHITSLPVAVTIECHAHRHKEVTL